MERTPLALSVYRPKMIQLLRYVIHEGEVFMLVHTYKLFCWRAAWSTTLLIAVQKRG